MCIYIYIYHASIVSIIHVLQLTVYNIYIYTHTSLCPIIPYNTV